MMKGFHLGWGLLLVGATWVLNAAIVPSMDTPRYRDGIFEFFVQGESHGIYRIETTTAFHEWTAITTNEDRASRRLIQLPSPDPSRFFRARGLPSPKFPYALAAIRQIELNGNNLSMDSFDSSDPLASTDGLYDPTKSRDQADLAALSGLWNSLATGNAHLKGYVLTSAAGPTAIGPNGSVGSSAWHAAGNIGIESGHYLDDLTWDIPNHQAPFQGGAYYPVSSLVDGEFYNYRLDQNNYQMTSLYLHSSQKLAVTGHATLYVTGSININGLALIRIFPGASLKLFVGPSPPSTNSAQVAIGGRGIINPGPAERFQLYGLPSVTHLSLTQLEPMSGVVHAPNTSVTLGVGKFSGSCLGHDILLNNHLNAHYDEALRLLSND